MQNGRVTSLDRADASTGEAPPRVEHAMVSRPKTWPVATTTVADAAEAFTDHVHLLLLVDGATLVGTLARDDIAGADMDESRRPAADFATLAQRTVLLGTPLEAARAQLDADGVRRVAVVDADGMLAGLLCLKRHRRGFCSDVGVAARAADRREGA